MYVLTEADKKNLSSLSRTPDGSRLYKMFSGMRAAVDSVSDITEDHAVHVEARKIVRTLLTSILASLEVRKESSPQGEDLDNFE